MHTDRAAAPPATVAVPLRMDDGRTLSFTVDAGRPGPALFALGVRKSGSSLFSNLATALARFNGVNVVDVPATMFDQGYGFEAWNRHPGLPGLVRGGNLYTGFRDPPTGLFGEPAFRAGRKILLVRDPRDALVSEYFSNAYSHALPSVEGEASTVARERAAALASSVNAYAARRAAALDATVSAYAPILDDPSLIVLRYEDVIFEKARWIRTIAAHFGLEAPDGLVTQMLGWADIRPAEEDPTRFVRRVTPGDHKAKLTPETVRAIEAALSPVWRRLGYGV
jgi:mono/diheme cytochrome c family protein